MTRIMTFSIRMMNEVKNLPAFTHDVQDTDLMHVEDDAGQVADDEDEDNQHEDDGEVFIMSLPSPSPSSEIAFL